MGRALSKIQLISVFLVCCSYFLPAQDLTAAQRKTWKKALKEMQRSDQLYRSKMVQHPELNNDSIWKLQSAIDSVNKQQFAALTNQFGYPSLKRVGNETSMGLILHFTLEKDLLELEELFKSELSKGNMPPKHYAWWYDRCQRNRNLPIYYGQYTNERFCGEQLELFNLRRKEIGLELLNPGPDCN